MSPPWRPRRWLSYLVHIAMFRRHPMKPGDTVFLGDSITAQGKWQALPKQQPDSRQPMRPIAKPNAAEGAIISPK